ncbi:MAG TPA: amidohydrolase family protein [Acidimicrobiales bacterium]|nr:amidohydrolase family protein [Acidimicrobiales bacterium]
MLDYAITGGTVVDGTGAPAVRADVSIKDGRIVEIVPAGPRGASTLAEPAATTFDAEGLVVAPGIVDVHTHYDAQLYWDPYATPSNVHGVTTVFGGNCGFTLAPLRAEDGDYIRRMMARVEGMAIPALEAGAPWDWESFGDYLAGLEGRVGVNAGFLVGHCALRRYVMGADAVEREATEPEVAEMVAVLHDSIAAGGLGLSTTRSSTHMDGDERPVASRLASEDELVALCSAVGEHEGTTLEGIVEGCLRGFSEEEADLLARVSAAANRPINWNVLTVSGRHQDKAEHQLLPSRRARQAGGRVIALMMPVHAEMNMSLGTFCALWLIPGWSAIMSLPFEEKAAALRDPARREEMLAKAKGTPFSRLTHFATYHIGDTGNPANAELEGRRVGDIARERGQDPFECLCEIAIADDFRTVLWPTPGDDGDDDWALRRELWDDPDVMLGGSDAGAHLDRMMGSSYPTRFLADCLHGRRLVSLERSLQMMTDVPAQLYGLRERGRLQPGYHADVFVFDPETVGSGPARRVWDLPGESLRLTASSTGVRRVLVNGVVTVADGEPTGALPGTVLRSGRDTQTFAAR